MVFLGKDPRKILPVNALAKALQLATKTQMALCQDKK